MTIEELKLKWWYRLLKVIYIIAYIFAILFIIFLAYDARPQQIYYQGPIYGSWTKVYLFFIIGLTITCIIFEIIKGIFSYVATGKWIAFKNLKNN